MPRKIIPLVTNEFYHIVNRGVEQRNIFLGDGDRLRFVNSLLVFNDAKPTPWHLRRFWEEYKAGTFFDYKPETPLVEIHALSLMNNHFHLLLRQIRDNGISEFMRKIGGYASYFNKKYQRIGSLFQGRFRGLLIKTEAQLINTFIYIHTNPIELIEPQWKELKLKNPLQAFNFLRNYQWSSYPNYIGKKDFKGFVKKDFFLRLFGDERECENVIRARVLEKADFGQLRDIIFE